MTICLHFGRAVAIQIDVPPGSKSFRAHCYFGPELIKLKPSAQLFWGPSNLKKIIEKIYIERRGENIDNKKKNLFIC